jgi:FRG domain-containing protein
MAKLEYYQSLDEKRASFNFAAPKKADQYYRIDDANTFSQWYQAMGEIKQKDGAYVNFFRGVGEARHKIYNSAQRYWIQNNLMELESLSQPIPYLEMIQNMVNKAKEIKLLQQVFDYYEITQEQMDFPILSILQHYKAPTPLIDWTYDLDIALYFAICDIKKSEKKEVIEDYVSIYRMNKNTHTSFLKNNLNYVSGNVFPSVKRLGGYLGDKAVIYISDFELVAADVDKNQRKIKPLTTYYNLNILAQQGLFVFNPHETRPLEAFADLHKPRDGKTKIYCYNISKDLAELIKYKIGKNHIDGEYLYPNLEQYSRKILDEYLKFVIE